MAFKSKDFKIKSGKFAPSDWCSLFALGEFIAVFSHRIPKAANVCCYKDYMKDKIQGLGGEEFGMNK